MGWLIGSLVGCGVFLSRLVFFCPLFLFGLAHGEIRQAKMGTVLHPGNTRFPLFLLFFSLLLFWGLAACDGAYAD